MSVYENIPSDWEPKLPSGHLRGRKTLAMDRLTIVESIAEEIDQLEETVSTQQVDASIQAGQLALGQYQTPHTRQAAEVAARTVQAALQEEILPDSERFMHGLTQAAIANAQQDLGQYFHPHARQAAHVASTEMLRQNGYLTEGQGEQ